MNFALALVHDRTLEVAAVMRSDVPFTASAGFAAQDHHMVLLGAFAAEDCPDGRPWTEWLREAIMVQPDGTIHVDFGGPRMLDAACTFDAIAAAGRRGKRIHAHVEAWLWTVLSDDRCEALGLRRSIPVSVIKALDRVRVARLQAMAPRDALSANLPFDSRRLVLERYAQRRSDEDAHRRHLARRRVHASRLLEQARARGHHEAAAALDIAMRTQSLDVANQVIAHATRLMEGKP